MAEFTRNSGSDRSVVKGVEMSEVGEKTISDRGSC